MHEGAEQEAEGGEDAEGAVAACVSRCAENVCRVLEGGERETTLAALRGQVLQCATQQTEQRVAQEALRHATAETDSSNIDQLEAKFNDHLKKLAGKQTKPEAHRFMIEFNNKISRLLQVPGNLDDSDLAMTESTDTYIDPITKRRIENPVRNKRCGHIYEQESIMEILRTKKKIKCPVAGCGDKTFITTNDLITDDELRFRMTLTQHSTMVQERSVMDLDCST